MKFFRLLRSSPLLQIILVLLIVLGGTAYYFYDRFSTLKATSQNTTEETADLVREVSKLILLPTDETPTIATVADPDALKNQEFFVNAKIGDKVLIYTNARKAILYDPTAKKIINVAPINIGQNSSTTGILPSPVQ
jgi:hypothetical protein